MSVTQTGRTEARGSYVRRSWVERTSARRLSRSPASNPWARAWTRTLPSAVASTGPAMTGSSQASAVSWQSSLLRAPPPTRWTTSIRRPASRVGVADRPRERAGEAVEDAADELRAGRRAGLRPRWTQAAEIAGRHVARRQEDGVVRVDRRPAGRQLAGRDQQRRQVLRRALELPGSERLLEQPQAHHVAQVADPVVDPALVGEVRGPALLAQDRAARARRRPATTSRRRCRRTIGRRPGRRRPPTPCRASRPA